MQPLNLPSYQFRIRQQGDKMQIFDVARRRFVALTPEEWVRQNVVAHLTQSLEYPLVRVANEVAITYNQLAKRCDTLIYNANFEPLMIVEYKAPTVEITQKVFDQIAVYNLKLHVPYLLVSNGLTHIFCQVDFENNCYRFLPEIPLYTAL